jgi:serine/threonine protein kinase
MFGREFEATCRLADPYVFPCYAFSITSVDFGERRTALLMKYGSNGSIRAVLDSVKSGSPPTFWNGTRIAIIVCGIACGLESVHSQGIVHRNFKPANNMLNGRGYCSMGDFGSSRVISA